MNGGRTAWACARSPRQATFAGYTTETKWSLAQVAYFLSYATWHYLIEPYIFTWPGVEAQEVEPWTKTDRRGASSA
jgi:hypothetical protein